MSESCLERSCRATPSRCLTDTGVVAEIDASMAVAGRLGAVYEPRSDEEGCLSCGGEPVGSRRGQYVDCSGALRATLRTACAS